MRFLALRSQIATLEQHGNRRNGHSLHPLPCLFVCNTPCPVSLWERRLAHGRSSARGAKTFPTGTGRPSENSGASAFRFTPCTAACPQAPFAPQGAPGGRAGAGARKADGHGKGHRREVARGNQRVLEAQGHRGPGGGLGAWLGRGRRRPNRAFPHVVDLFGLSCLRDLTRRLRGRCRPDRAFPQVEA